MPIEQINILLVEDDEDDYFITRNLLSKASSISCDIDWVRTYDEGIDLLVSESYDICLVDYRLGARNGLQLVREANNRDTATPMILLTGQGDIEVDLNAMMAGAADYLVKSKIDVDLLERSIRYARERQRADQRIREQAQLLDKARDAISAYSIDGGVIYWNKSARRLTGWRFDTISQFPARDAFEKLYGKNPELLEDALEQVQREDEWSGELTLRTREGEEVPVESRWSLVRDAEGDPTSILVIDTDVSERKQLERQFLRSQRMESIGRLVGGIAHDLGNLLVPVLLGVEVLQQRFPDDEKAMRTLDMIQKSARRGSDMVKQVLAFARGVEGDRVVMDVKPIIEEIERLTDETFPKEVHLKTRVPDSLSKIKGDSTQIQQILMNLCVNARDAMPDGGEIEISVGHASFTQEETPLPMDAEPGAFIEISVADTGEGIDAEDLDKIFEPFFTTKPTGEGTGLGLSTVYSIVKSHNGFVDVESEVGVGTTFTIYFPIAEEPEQVDDSENQELDRGDGETILLVDDEPYVIETTVDMLQRAGYHVVTAEDGAQALEVLERENVEVIVTDLIMPNMHGVDLIKEIEARGVDLPIIVISSPADSQGKDSLKAGADLFLSKPFTPERLCSSINKVLKAEA